MVTQLSFKHKTGSTKPIPGLDHSECSPKLVRVMKMIPEIGQYVPVLEAVPDHVVKVTLVSEDFVELTPAEKKLPERVRNAIEDERAQEYRERVKANQKVRDMLRFYENQGEVEVLPETEKSEDEVLKDGSLIVSLSAIAIADHIARGIPVPENLMEKDISTERVRAPKTAKTETPE